MKKVLFFVSVAAMAFLAQSCKHKDASAKIESDAGPKVVTVGDFNVISTDFPFQLIYEQKDTVPYLAIEGAPEVLKDIDVQVKDSLLAIAFKAPSTDNLKGDKVLIHTNSRNLKLVNLVGSGDFQVKGTLKEPKLEIRSSGSGNVSADDLQVGSLTVNTSGSGNVSLAGKVSAAAYVVSGSGGVTADKLASDNVRAYVTGSGDALLNVTKSLIANVSGSGNLWYVKKPVRIEKAVTGTGKVDLKK